MWGYVDDDYILPDHRGLRDHARWITPPPSPSSRQSDAQPCAPIPIAEVRPLSPAPPSSSGTVIHRSQWPAPIITLIALTHISGFIVGGMSLIRLLGAKPALRFSGSSRRFKCRTCRIHLFGCYPYHGGIDGMPPWKRYFTRYRCPLTSWAKYEELFTAFNSHVFDCFRCFRLPRSNWRRTTIWEHRAHGSPS